MMPAADSPPSRPFLAFGAEPPGRRVVSLRRRTELDTYEVLQVEASLAGESLSLMWQTHRALRPAGVQALHDALRAECPRTASPLGIDEVRALLARWMLVQRLTGRGTPVTQATVLGWIDPWDDAVALVEDLFPCVDCGESVPGESQLAVAVGKVAHEHNRCLACASRKGHLPPRLAPVPRLSACARLMLWAGEPRRALELVVEAERAGVPRPSLFSLRGSAHLALSNPVQAAVYLRHALHHDPTDLSSQARLAEAEAHCGLIASALGRLDRLVARRPSIGVDVEALREELSSLMPTGSGDHGDVELRCLQSMSLVDAGRLEEARQIFAGPGLVDAGHPMVQALHEEMLIDPSDGSRPAIRRARSRLGPGLARHLRSLSRACGAP